MKEPQSTASQWGDELATIIARAVARATSSTIRKIHEEAIHHRKTPHSYRWRFEDNSELRIQSDDGAVERIIATATGEDR